MEFCCQYCELYTLDILSILGLTILNHGDRFLSVKRKTTKDGVTGYVSKHYHIIPEILKSENKKIWISPGDENIKITEVCSEKTIEKFSKSENDDLRMEDDSNKDNEFQGKCKQPHEINLATVLNKIPNNDSQRDNFWLFIHLTLQDRFPMQSIAFLLFLDVVRWFSESKISAMRYSDRSKSFWQIGFRLFHTKFLNFMRGLGNQNLVMKNIGIREKFDPENSKINFAVPSKASLSCMPTVLPKTIQPGIIKELLSFISTTDHVTTKSWKICVDLKKINSGRGGDSIPVDLWGYEDKPNRLEKQTELEADLQVIQCITERINSLIALEHESLSILRDNEQVTHIKKGLFETFEILCQRLKVLRQYLVGKEANLKKIMEKSEKQSPGDWKKSKYAYAISAMKTNIGMTKDCIDSLLRVNDRICKYFSYMNGSETSFVIGKEADMNNQPNYFCLRSEFYKETNSQCTKFLQQRSDEWFELRKQAKVTASTMHTALGLRTLKEQQAHYDSVILNKDKDGVQSPTPQMLHGIENEKHGVATICGKILPSLFPKIKFKEVGCYVKWREDKPFLVASPDGEGDEGQMKRFLFEIKCPYKSDWKTNVSYSIPNYYVLQLITQMGASKESYGYHIPESIFVSWSEESTTAFLVKFDEDLYTAIVTEAEFLYGTHNRRPTKKKPKTKELKALIDTFLTQNVKYLGEFKSLKAIQCRHDSAQTDGVYGSHSPSTEQRRTFNAIDLSEIKSCIDDVKCLINQHFTLCFDRPSDVMVFMLSDLDRTYAIDKPYVFPVAYGLSPKHLKADTVRQMLEFLREQLKTYNIHVQVEAFDGQFSKLSIVSYDGSSLSELQERKMHWKETCAKSSHELLRPFLQLGNVCGPVKTFDDINEKWKLTINYRTDNHGNLLHGPITCNTCYLKLSSSEEQNVWREVFEKPSNFKTNTKSKNDNTENNACKDYDENNIQNLSLPDEITIPHISNNNYQTMLEYLTKNTKAKRQKLWKLKDLDRFVDCFDSTTAIDKSFTKDELQGMLKVNTQEIKLFGLKQGLSSKSNKCMFTNFFAKVSGSKVVAVSTKLRSPKALKVLLREKFASVRKETLNRISSHIEWPFKLDSWQRQNCSPITISELLEMGFVTKHDWFTTPERSSDGTILLRFLDHHHLLTNCRIHCCRNGFKALKINSFAWLKVAKSSKLNGTGLNVAYVEDLVDSQSNLVAQLTFSKDVETEMIKNNDASEANFCRLIREWYEAVDEKGLSANGRVQKLLNLREFLLDSCQTCLRQFPPPGSHVCDIPVILFTGLITSCERLIQLYRLSKTGTYNVRSIGSLDNETFFSSFRDLDPRGAGVLKTSEIPKAMSVACEILTTRMNPNRGFYLNTTTKRPVYNQQTEILLPVVKHKQQLYKKKMWPRNQSVVLEAMQCLTNPEDPLLNGKVQS